MTLVKMLTNMASPEGCASIGQEIDVDEKEARALIKGKYAVKVERETRAIEAESEFVPPPLEPEAPVEPEAPPLEPEKEAKK